MGRYLWRRKSAPVSKRSDQGLGRKSWKLLLWTALAGLIFGLIGFGEIAEDYLRTARNSLHWSKASGDIVLIDIDDDSIREVGQFPWSRGKYTRLVDELTRAHAKRIFIDMMMDGAGDAREDAGFAAALSRSNRVVLPAITRFGARDGQRIERVPLAAFAERAQ